MTLDLKKIDDVYSTRQKKTYGLTYIAFHDAKNPNWFDELLNFVNLELSKSLGQKYLSYGSHKHITILGLNNVDRNMIDEICNDLNRFPPIQIKDYRFRLLDNGLVVVEFYPIESDKKLLDAYRLSFEKYGIHYKYSDARQKFHSVLGQLIPQEIKSLSESSLQNIAAEIEKILDKASSSFNVPKIIEVKDIKLVEYTVTTLKGAKKIACNNKRRKDA